MGCVHIKLIICDFFESDEVVPNTEEDAFSRITFHTKLSLAQSTKRSSFALIVNFQI